ncbi:YciI family protein [Dictyobacter aurantiacus]|uniref:YCII-related domain-containing protein n=1 Tax=Dictyobacter aurantiacus TaxID=1936993 RepID=A0A401ZRC8_9CHLR|nr:YciI family protein [Dictyobacter aurantiacus]GCE09427.1 hypothetical protein KDAU_67560 [Dictyobacter aurantiacus]
MPKQYFAVTLECGDNWDARYPMREQAYWDEHARLMDELVDDGFIVLGGPLGGEEKVLLVIDAESRQALDAGLADDPWLVKGVRRIARVERWTILLESTHE